jgi:hypothetical protein
MISSVMKRVVTRTAVDSVRQKLIFIPRVYKNDICVFTGILITPKTRIYMPPLNSSILVIVYTVMSGKYFPVVPDGFQQFANFL